MSKKLKLVVMLCIVFGMLLSVSIVSQAATVATSINLKVTVLKDDIKTAVPGLTARLYDGAMNPTPVMTGTDSSGTYTFSSITTKGAYYVTISSSSGASVTIPVPIAAFSTTDKIAKVVFVEKSTMTTSKSGVIGGLAVDNSGAPLSGVTVKAYTPAGVTYATTSDNHGAYKLYVPAGTYTLVIVGLESGSSDSYKNISYTIAAARGQMSGPLEDANAKTAWGTNENKLGLSVSSFDGNDKVISGTAMAGTTVSAYVYDSVAQKYTYLASSPKVSKSSTTSTTGAFRITLTSYYPNQKIAIRVKDAALNEYEDQTYINATVAKESMKLTPSTTATITTTTIIKCVDSVSTAMNAYLASNIGGTITATSSAVTGQMTFTKNTDYTVASGTITFKAGVLATAGAYNITITANNYNNGYVTQTILPSKLAPLSFAKAVVAASSTSAGATKITISDTKVNPSNIYGIIVTSSTAVTAYYKYNPLPSYTTYTSGSDILGVDPLSTKYIHLFELAPTATSTSTSGATVVRYKKIALTATQIKSPVVSSIVASGSAVTITYDDGTLNTTAPAAIAYHATVNTPTDASTTYLARTVSGVAVSGKTVTLTLAKALAKEDKVKITYAVPSTNPVKDSYGNKVAAIAATATVNNNTPQGPTVSSAVASAAASTITLTFNTALTNGSADKPAFIVKKGTTALTVGSVTVSGTTVTLNITAGTTNATKLVSGDSTVTVTYKATGTNDLTNGNLVGNINAKAVSVP